jgi:uracil phosphoribosyltransferase
MSFEHSFSFEEAQGKSISGRVRFDEPHGVGVIYRDARLTLDSGREMPIVITHSPAAAQIFYLSKRHVTPSFASLLGLPNPAAMAGRRIQLPGQLIMGAERAHLFREAVDDCFRHPELEDFITEMGQERTVVVPVLREGIKYGIVKVLNDRFDFYLDEIVADASHVEDESDSIYGRDVQINVFKDADVLPQIRERVETVIVGDSIASGVVLIGLLEKLVEKFPALSNVELISPLSTIHGLARVADHAPEGLNVRAVVLETLLNALPPEFYWSAHYPGKEYHIRHDLQKDYEKWWGGDEDGNQIADTACAGYGWSEAFFNPRKQVALINSQLQERHGLTIAEIILRNN